MPLVPTEADAIKVKQRNVANVSDEGRHRGEETVMCQCANQILSTGYKVTVPLIGRCRPEPVPGGSSGSDIHKKTRLLRNWNKPARDIIDGLDEDLRRGFDVATISDFRKYVSLIKYWYLDTNQNTKMYAF